MKTIEMTDIELNELAFRVRRNNASWWRPVDTGEEIIRNPDELIMLVVTELAEALEGIRKNLMDDKLPHRKMEEVEMADALIRLLDYAGGFGIQLCMPAVGYAVTDNKAEALFCIVKILNIDSYSISMAIRQIFSYCERFDLDLIGAMEEKLDYNLTRADHSMESRRSANGKKF